MLVQEQSKIILKAYTTWTHLYRGACYDYFRSYSLSGQYNVLIKLASPPFDKERILKLLTQDYEIGKSLALASTAKYLGLEESVEGPMVIQACTPTEGLLISFIPKAGFEVFKSVQLLKQITIALMSVHRCDITHRNVTAETLCWDPKTNTIKLSGFDFSSRIAQEKLQISYLNKMVGTLSHLSPEQTGRINQVVDYRTDFYALGVLFFQLLTGVLPFDGLKPTEIIYAHIAKPIPELRCGKQKIPEMIIQIVEKLMAKNADDRYQSCQGLLKDLERSLSHLNTLQDIPTFELGKEDYTRKFQIPYKLYGREKETAILSERLGHITPAGTEVILVTGYSGIGKSVLVDSLHYPLAEQRGYFLKGKFDLINNNVAYSAISRAFQQLVKQLLSEGDEVVAKWQQALQQALEPNGQLILEIVPDMSLIIGPQAPVKRLGPNEERNRFNFVFKNLLRVFSENHCPLVLFLDDLQWADPASLALLAYLGSIQKNNSLLIIGAYRDNEVNQGHLLTKTINSLQEQNVPIKYIQLKPLSPDDIHLWLKDTLHTKGDKARPLAELTHLKTQGNPFFVRSFWQMLYDNGQFTQKKDYSWHWQLEQIQMRQITDNVVEFVLVTIKELPPKVKKLLSLAACLGNHFTLKQLAQVAWQPQSEVKKYLQVTINASFLLQYDGVYSFSHDRIKEAASLLIAKHDLPKWYLRIGLVFLKAYHARDLERSINLSNIVEYLNAGASLITDEKDRIKLAKLNMIVGQQAKQSVAYASAKQYFSVARTLLPEQAWQNHHRMTAKIYKSLSECAYVCADISEAKHCAETLLTHAKSNLEKAEILCMLGSQYTFSGELIRAIETLISALCLIGVDIPLNPSNKRVQLDMKEIACLLRTNNVFNTKKYTLVTDKKIKLAFKALGNLYEACHHVGNVNLLMILAFKKIDLSLTYGYAPESAIAYVIYGTILMAVDNDLVFGVRYARLGLNIARDIGDLKLQSNVLHAYGTYIHYWSHPCSSTLSYFKESITCGIRSGAVSFASYACTQMALFLPMDDITQNIAAVEKYVNISKDIKYQDGYDAIRIHHQFWLNLLGKTKHYLSLSNHDFDEDECLERMEKNNFQSGFAYYYTIKLILRFTFEDELLSISDVDTVDTLQRAILGVIWNIESALYGFLILARIYPKLKADDKKKIMLRLEKRHKKSIIWANYNSDNFSHINKIMEAELARLNHKYSVAESCYLEAMEMAATNNHLRYQALGAELAAKYYLQTKNIKIACVYFREALQLYCRWGAVAKAKQLYEKYFHYEQARAFPIEWVDNTSLQHLSHTEQHLDFATITRASQAISEERQLEKLSKIIMQITLESAGAKRGFLMMVEDGELIIRAADSLVSDQENLSLPIALTDIDKKIFLSQHVINLVRRTKTHVLLQNASEKHDFSHDPYFVNSSVQSVLCLPIIKQERLLAILYLENDSASRVFTQERVEVLKILATQSAISLDNALCYLLETQQKAKQHNLKLAEFSRLATVGEMALGFAHELNQPLSSVVQYAGGCIHRLNKLDVSSDIVEAMKHLEQQAEFAGSIIHRLKNFLVKDQNTTAVPIDFQTLISDVVSAIQPLLESSQTVCQTNCDAFLPQLYIDNIQFEKMLYNLAYNAVEAMQSVSDRRRLLGISVERKSDDIVVSVSDTGTGIDNSVEDKIFNRFFTTKSHGWGIGLAMCRTIAEAHHGAITFTTKMGEGTTFFIRLPIRSLQGALR